MSPLLVSSRLDPEKRGVVGDGELEFQFPFSANRRLWHCHREGLERNQVRAFAYTERQGEGTRARVSLDERGADVECLDLGSRVEAKRVWRTGHIVLPSDPICVVLSLREETGEIRIARKRSHQSGLVRLPIEAERGKPILRPIAQPIGIGVAARMKSSAGNRDVVWVHFGNIARNVERRSANTARCAARREGDAKSRGRAGDKRRGHARSVHEKIRSVSSIERHRQAGDIRIPIIADGERARRPSRADEQAGKC